MTKKESGITLVALTVTVILLLILSGITIVAITGGDGIIENAMKAKNATELAQIKEEVMEKWYELENETAKDYHDNSTMADLFEEKLKEKDANATAEYVAKNETFEINYMNQTLEMTEDGQVVNNRTDIASIIKEAWDGIKDDSSYPTTADKMAQLAEELGIPQASVTEGANGAIIIAEYSGYKATITQDGNGKTTVTLEAIEIEKAQVTITTQPEDAKILVGGSNTFTVEAQTTGTATYQWYTNSTNTTIGGTIIRGATENTYTISNAATTNTKYYYCEVTDKYNGKTAKGKSNAAYLRVIKEITNDDMQVAQTPVIVEAGSSINLGVTLDTVDDQITYQWYYNDEDSNANGTAITGATQTTYTKASAANEDEKYYYCVATQSISGTTRTATSATIHVYVKTSLAITTQPSAAQINAGESASLTVAAVGSGTITYQWYKTNSADDMEGTPIQGATSSTYEVTNATYQDDGYYYCSVKQIYEPDNTNVTQKTELVRLAVNRVNPTITLSSNAGEVNYGSTASFTAEPSATPAVNGTWIVASSNTSNVTIESGNGATATNNTPTTITFKGAGATANATTITITFTPTDLNNYSPVSTTYTVTKVNKIDATNPSLLAAYSGTYDGAPHTIEVSNDYEGGNIQFSWDGTAWEDWTNQRKPEQTNATPTAVTVYIRVQGDQNHNTTNAITSTIYIEPKSAGENNLQIELSQNAFTYTGGEQKPSITVTDNATGATLTLTTDYTITYPNDVTNVGEKTITITGAGNYSSSTTATYRINPKAIDGNDISITVTSSSIVYNRGEQKPETITIKDTTRNADLSLNADYTLTYPGENSTPGDIINVGEKTITITGAGNYCSTNTATYNIVAKDASNLNIILSPNTFVYNGSNQTPTITVKDGETTLNINSEYTYEVTNNKNVGTATVTVTGVGNYTGTKDATFTITSRETASLNLELSQSTYTYDGTPKEPSITVKEGDTTLTNNTDYTYTITNNINAGTALVTVTGAGNYNGAVQTANFTINKIALTLTAGSSEKQYDGSALTNSTYTISSGALAPNQTITTLTTTGTITNAGTVANPINQVVIKNTSNENVTANYEITKQSGTLTITKVTPTITLSSQSGTVNYSSTNTFTATPSMLPAVAGTWSITSSNTAKVTIQSGNSEAASNDTPTTITYNGVEATNNATTITVTYTPSDTTNYNAVNATYTVTAVNKIDATNPTTITEYSGSYDGSSHTITVSNDHTGGSIQYSYSEDGTNWSGWSPTKPTRTDVGTTNIKIYVAGDQNHNDSSQVLTRIHIGSAAMTITSSNYEGTYDGVAHGITVTVTNPANGPAIYYSTTKALYQDNYQEGSQTNPTFTAAGTYTVYWYVNPGANSNYAGRSGSNTVTINQKSINTNIQILLNNSTEACDLTYDGTSQKPTVRIIDLNLGALTEGTHYTLTYPTDATNVGEKTIIITGIGNYSSETTNSATYTISKKSIAGNDIQITLSQTSFTYNGTSQTPGTITVQDQTRGVTLSQGTDYTVTMPENTTDAGTKTIRIVGAGNYSSATNKSATYTISPKDASYLSLTLSPTTYTYDGTAKTPTVTVKDGSTTLTVGAEHDYTVAYTNNTEVGTATATITGVNNYTGTLSGNFTITERPATNFTVTLTENSAEVTDSTYTYDGTAKTPQVAVYDGETLLTNNTDYTYTITNNINAGSALVTVVGKGNYDINSSKAVNFKINKVALTLTAGSSEKQYDGTALTNNTVNITSGELVTGHNLTATTSGTITEIGSVENPVATAQIKDSGNTDVTANYQITKQSGTLVVTSAGTQITYSPQVADMVKGNTRTVTATVSPAISGTWEVTSGSAVNITAGNGATGTSTNITYTGAEVGAATISITFRPTNTNYTETTTVYTQNVTDAYYQVGTTYYSTLTEAYNDANVETEGITVLKNSEDLGSFTISNKTIAINLGTNQITRGSGIITVANGGTLEINATTQGNETGTIIGTSANPINVTGGEVNINSGILQSTGNRVITLSSGTVNVGQEGETLSETSPLVTGGAYGIYKTGGDWNYYNGQVRGTTQVSTYDPTNIRTGGYIYDYDNNGTYQYSTFTVPANAPMLTAGMIPIKYDDGTNKWKICKTTDSDWYSYTAKNKKWANVMLSDGAKKYSDFSDYINSPDATMPDSQLLVNEADLGSMYVWIPRYAYSIVKNYNMYTNADALTKQDNIKIQYLVGATNTDIEGNTYNADYDATLLHSGDVTPMIVHPTFTSQTNYVTNEHTQLPGIWIAKFEASGTNQSGDAVGNHTNGGSTLAAADDATVLKSLPSKISWRNLHIGAMQYRSTQMSTKADYGWTENTVDTHLIKNSEWGAVAYLCYSRFGVTPMKNANGTSANGRYYDLYTGMGPAANDSDNGTYTSTTMSTHTYSTTNGKLASTTRNVYGIYDMSGGAWEYLASYLDNGYSYLNSYGNATGDNNVKYFEQADGTNWTLKSQYSALWEKYEEADEMIADSITITNDDQTTTQITKSQLWNTYVYTNAGSNEKYNKARQRLTDEVVSKLPKGIGMREISNRWSYWGVVSDGSWNWMYRTNYTSSVSATGWTGDNHFMGDRERPFVRHGGGYYDGTNAGVLCWDGYTGYGYAYTGFRAAINPTTAATTPSTVVVTIAGECASGEALTADLTGSVGDGAISYKWWYSESPTATTGNAIEGANSSTYTISSDYVGKYIGVTVTMAAGREYTGSIGYDITDNAHNGTGQVRLTQNYSIATAGGTTYYDRLSKAVNGATDGQTITVLQNCTDTELATINKNVTLNTSIYTITRETGVIDVDTGGTLTITGTGTITTTTINAINVTGGTLNVNSGNIVTTNNTGNAINIAAGTINIGRQSDAINTEAPMVTGGSLGIGQTGGEWNYYNGCVRGTSHVSTYSPVGVRSGYLYDYSNDGTYEFSYFTAPANAPGLVAGMIPVKYDETEGKWKICKASDPDWYSYTTREMKWANVMLSDGAKKYDTYSNFINNDATNLPSSQLLVNDEDLGSMFVWIPRYAYSIEHNYNTATNETAPEYNASGQRNIRVQYLVGTTNADMEGNVYASDYDASALSSGDVTPMIVHPTFTSQISSSSGTAKQLPGVWIAKFEASGTNSSGDAVGNHTNGGSTVAAADETTIVKSLPSKISWRNIAIGAMQYTSTQMSAKSDYGWNASTVDSHLIKNSEWGAVAYLCYSNYGSVPMKNANGTYTDKYFDMYTGMGPATNNSDDGRYDSTTMSTHTYSTANGKLASTTRNVYGIYDMSGGAWEYVASYLDNGHSYLNSYGNATGDNNVKYFEQADGTNWTLKSQYSALWEKYEEADEMIADSITITNDDNSTTQITKSQLWNTYVYTNAGSNEKYNKARKRLTDEVVEKLPKGIGMRETSHQWSYWGVVSDGSWNWMYGTNYTSSVATTGWTGDYHLMGDRERPFVGRGGSSHYGTRAGVLSWYSYGGYSYYGYGFRPALHTANPTHDSSVVVTITGENTSRETLTADLTGSVGDGAISYQWWWSNDANATTGTAIEGANSSTYTLSSTDVGKYIGVTVAMTAGVEYRASTGYDITDDTNNMYGRVNLTQNYSIATQSGTNYYDRLGLAVADATAGQTIEVMQNVEDPDSVLINKDVTLDTNLYTITRGTGVITVGSGGTLTIEGDGTITSSTINTISVTGGTVNLDSGNIATSNGSGNSINMAAGTVNVGTQGGEINSTSPMVAGGRYGIYQTGGDWNYYNGVVKGTTKVASYDAVNARTGYLYDYIKDGSFEVSYFTMPANSPGLVAGMIPIKYDTINNKWKICKASDPDWYSYTTKDQKWANVMLSDGAKKYDTYSNFINNDLTTLPDNQLLVNEEDLGSMFVWIPRYAYSIEHNYNTATNETAPEYNASGQRNIRVKYLVGTTNADMEGNVYASDYDASALSSGDVTPMIVHPTFTSQISSSSGTAKQLPGVWIAKFEASGTNSSGDAVGNHTNGGSTVAAADETTIVKSLPSKVSWRNTHIGAMQYTSTQMSAKADYGWNASTVDSHMIKNSEWGAVAYLCYSNYGSVPMKNANGTSTDKYFDMYTGMGPATDGSDTGLYDSTTMNSHTYSTTNGKLASTTRNIYGIYDMSGGSWEYTASYLDNGHSYLNSFGNATGDNNVKYFEQVNGNYTLKSQYAYLWEKYEEADEMIADSITITNDDNSTTQITKDALWNTHVYSSESENLKYNKARQRLTDEVVSKLPKGIGMRETSHQWSYYGVVSEGTWNWMYGENYTSTVATTGWTGDYHLMGDRERPFVNRGGTYTSSAYAGVLSWGNYSGGSSYYYGFRAALHTANPTHDSSVVVTITGENTSRETLTADLTGSVGDGAISYQWWWSNDANATTGTAIEGANSSTYTLSSTDVGKYIGVTVAMTAGVEYRASTGYDITDDTNNMYGRVNLTQNYSIATQGGTNYYDRLGLAVADATAGQTIEVLQDVEDPDSVLINKDVTLDTNLYTITRGTGVITVGSGGTLTIEGDGTITSSTINTISVTGGTVNLDSGNIATSNGSGNSINMAAGTVNVGTQGGAINSTSPAVTGGSYGIYQTGGDWNYYNGVVKGTTRVASYNAVNARSGYLYDYAQDGSFVASCFTAPANAPGLTEGMIPIKFDTVNDKWKICKASDPDWYSYTTREMKWANVMLSDGSKKFADYSNFINNAEVSLPDNQLLVNESDLGSMFVWIPRYAYSIVENFNSVPNPIDNALTSHNYIKVDWLVGTSDYDVTGTQFDLDYDYDDFDSGDVTTPIVHPTFTSQTKCTGDTYTTGGSPDQLPGVWIAKFEASGTNSSGQDVGNNVYNSGSDSWSVPSADGTTLVKSLPSKPSWRYIYIGAMEYRATQMKKKTDYGWTADTVDTHLIKNSEWGAVAYLCYSRFGVTPMKNACGTNTSGVGYHDLYTGMGPATNGSDDGTYTSSEMSTHTYSTANGKLASTTRNVYGIYDMSGGAWEYTGSYLDNGNGSLNNNGNATGDNNVKYFEQADGTNWTLKSQYAALWERYEEADEVIANSIGIDDDDNGTIDRTVTKLDLWNTYKYDYADSNKPYNKARKRLTDEVVGKLPKGIGMFETSNRWAYWGVIAGNTYNWMYGENYSTSSITYGWTYDYHLMGDREYPFVMRGGIYANTTTAGVLSWSSIYGSSNNHYGFRAALLP